MKLCSISPPLRRDVRETVASVYAEFPLPCGEMAVAGCLPTISPPSRRDGRETAANLAKKKKVFTPSFLFNCPLHCHNYQSLRVLAPT